MVRVSNSLWQQLKKIVDSGEVDTQNPTEVIAYAKKHGLTEAVRAVQGNQSRYLRCVNEGMEPIDTCL
jgi:hypothetical protein